jgi:hypothetical protein
MPSFNIDGPKQLASFFHGMTVEQGIKLYEAADASETTERRATAALRFNTESASGKTKRTAILIGVHVNDSDGTAYVWTDEYHPRKDGKADMVFETDYVYKYTR